MEHKTIVAGFSDREHPQSMKSQLPRGAPYLYKEFAGDDSDHDDDVEGDDVSDLSDHDSHADDHDFVSSSMDLGYHSDHLKKCFHPSMVPAGLQAQPMTLKHLLVLKNTASLKSLTAGSEHDDIPRLPSRNRIHSVSSPVLSRYEQQKRSTMNNASWDEPPKPCGSTGLSSNPLLNRFHPSMSNLNQESLRSKTCHTSSASREFRTEVTRRPPSRTDLRSNSAWAAVGPEQTAGGDRGNATWSNFTTKGNPLAPGSSEIRKNMFLGGKGLAVVASPTQQEPKLSDVSRLVSTPMSDSAPCMPHRRASNGGAAGQFQGGYAH